MADDGPFIWLSVLFAWPVEQQILNRLPTSENWETMGHNPDLWLLLKDRNFGRMRLAFLHGNIQLEVGRVFPLQMGHSLSSLFPFPTLLHPFLHLHCSCLIQVGVFEPTPLSIGSALPPLHIVNEGTAFQCPLYPNLGQLPQQRTGLRNHLLPGRMGGKLGFSRSLLLPGIPPKNLKVFLLRDAQAVIQLN